MMDYLKNLSPPKKVLDILKDRTIDEAGFRELELFLTRVDSKVESSVQSLTAEKAKSDQLNQELGRIQSEKSHIVEYAKRLACPTRLCHSMERFPVRYLLSIDQGIKDQREIHNNLLNVLESKSKSDLLSSCVLQLITVIQKNPTDQQAAFGIAFNRLKNAKFDLLQSQNLDDFGKAVYEINQESDSDAAFNIWKNTSIVWQNRATLKKLPLSDDNMIKMLTFIPPVVLLKRIEDGEFNLINEKVCETRHLDYTKACLKSKKIFNADVSKQYKLVLWTLFMSPNIEIKELWEKFDKEWPTLDKSLQADCYATEFAELYNLVSIVDKYGPGLQPPSICKPSENDFNEYIQHLAVTSNDRLCFVARTLCFVK